MTSFVSDFLYAFRIFYKRPGLTLLSILALAVSLGLSTATFSILNGMFFKPLPFEKPEELHYVMLHNTKSDVKLLPIPSEQLESVRELNCFEDIMACYSGTINISGDGKPERYNGAFISSNFLELLGHQPILGRTFSTESDMPDGPRELLLSHDVWKSRYRGDPDILGSVVRVNGSQHTIVGVLPEGFHFPLQASVWVPLNSTIFPGSDRKSMHVVAIGRLADGRTISDAQEQLASLYKSWESSSLEEKDNLELVAGPLGRMELNNASRSLIIVYISAVTFVLLISCANVANLLVGRALSRGREMAIRSALGATRKRIVRQLLTESLVLSLFGTIGGLLYAAWAVDASIQNSIWELPYWMNFELDWRVFLAAFAIMLLTTLISGLVPAWQASKIDLNEMLKDTSHTSTGFQLGRLTRVLAVVQIAFSCALLFGAGLVTRNVLDMRNLDPGFNANEVLTMRMGLFPQDYPGEADRDAFYKALTDGVDEVPGVTSSAVSSWLGQFGNYKEPFILASAPQSGSELPYAYMESVSGDYFPTLGMHTVRGRTFIDEDTVDSARVVVVNETFVNQFMKGTDPIGQKLNLFLGAKQPESEDADYWQIVGVVSDVRVSKFTSPNSMEATIYTPFTQIPSPFMSLMVHTNSTSMTDLQESIQGVIRELDPNLPVYFTKTMEEYILQQIQPYNMLANFLMTIGVMALFLAAIGVYGMLAFNVSRRRREIGIRMALGANSRNIVTQVLRQGFIQLIVGVTIGSGLAYLVGQLTRNFLIGVNPADPSVLAGVLLTLVGVATLAFSLPARRAARLSPMDALRYE